MYIRRAADGDFVADGFYHERTRMNTNAVTKMVTWNDREDLRGLPRSISQARTAAGLLRVRTHMFVLQPTLPGPA